MNNPVKKIFRDVFIILLSIILSVLVTKLFSLDNNLKGVLVVLFFLLFKIPTIVKFIKKEKNIALTNSDEAETLRNNGNKTLLVLLTSVFVIFLISLYGTSGDGGSLNYLWIAPIYLGIVIAGFIKSLYFFRRNILTISTVLIFIISLMLLFYPIVRIILG